MQENRRCLLRVVPLCSKAFTEMSTDRSVEGPAVLLLSARARGGPFHSFTLLPKIFSFSLGVLRGRGTLAGALTAANTGRFSTASQRLS